MQIKIGAIIDAQIAEVLAPLSDVINKAEVLFTQYGSTVNSLIDGNLLAKLDIIIPALKDDITSMVRNLLPDGIENFMINEVRAQVSAIMNNPEIASIVGTVNDLSTKVNEAVNNVVTGIQGKLDEAAALKDSFIDGIKQQVTNELQSTINLVTTDIQSKIKGQVDALTQGSLQSATSLVNAMKAEIEGKVKVIQDLMSSVSSGDVTTMVSGVLATATREFESKISSFNGFINAQSATLANMAQGIQTQIGSINGIVTEKLGNIDAIIEAKATEALSSVTSKLAALGNLQTMIDEKTAQISGIANDIIGKAAGVESLVGSLPAIITSQMAAGLSNLEGVIGNIKNEVVAYVQGQIEGIIRSIIPGV